MCRVPQGADQAASFLETLSNSLEEVHRAQEFELDFLGNTELIRTRADACRSSERSCLV